MTVRPFDPRLLRLLPQCRGPVGLLGALGVLGGVAAVAQAFAVAALVVAVVEDASPTGAAWTLVAIAAGRAVIAAASEIGAARAGVTVSTALRERLLEVMLSRGDGGSARDPEAQPATPAVDAFTVATSGATAVEPYVARYLPALIGAGALPVLTIGTMLFVDWPSALIVVLTVPLLPVFAALIGHATADATRRRWAALAGLSGQFLDAVRGLPTLVAYGRARRQTGQVRSTGDRHRVATIATLKLAFTSSAALELLATISVAMVAVAVGLRLAAGSMPLGTGLVAILLAPEAYWPIRRVGAEFHSAADGAAAIDDALGLLESAAGGAPVPAVPALGRIVADRLRFRYPGAPVDALAAITFTAPRGLTVITGASGSGKTTLLTILAGLRAPTSGTVHAPRTHLVTQRPFLLPGTVRENLLIGAGVTAGPARTDGELADTLDAVGLLDQLPAGLDTVIGDDGFGLSAGQRARLGMARAMLDDAPALAFDEPTAHLDGRASEAVHAVLARLAREHIVIAVTHRRDLVDIADTHIEIGPDAAPSEIDAAAGDLLPAGAR